MAAVDTPTGMSGHSPGGQAPPPPELEFPVPGAGAGGEERAAGTARRPARPSVQCRGPSRLSPPVSSQTTFWKWTVGVTDSWMTDDMATQHPVPARWGRGAPRSGGAGRRGELGRLRAPWAEGPRHGGQLSPGGRALWAELGIQDTEEGYRDPWRTAHLAWPLPLSAGDPTSSHHLCAWTSSCEGGHAGHEALGLAGAARPPAGCLG